MEQMLARLKSDKMPLTAKYLDTIYMCHAITANANYSIYASTLVQGAVHGSMAGFTNFAVFQADEVFVYLSLKMPLSKRAAFGGAR